MINQSKGACKYFYVTASVKRSRPSGLQIRLQIGSMRASGCESAWSIDWMIVQLRVQGRFNGDLDQHHPKLVEIFFCLDVLGCRLGDSLQFFLLHNLPILTGNRAQ